MCVLVFVIVRYDERAVHWLLSPLRRVKRAGFAERVERAAVNTTRGLVALRDPRDRDPRLLLTIASWLVLAFSYWILMAAFHLDIPLVAGILVTVAINLSLGAAVVTGGARRLRGSDDRRARAFDIPQADALSYALVLHLLNLVPFLVIGAVLLGPAALRRNR